MILGTSSPMGKSSAMTLELGAWMTLEMAAPMMLRMDAPMILGVIDLFTDSDVTMRDTLDIPAYISSINHLLISRVINAKGNI